MTFRPVRLQLSRRKGFDLQALSRAINGLPAMKVDRATKWGNPFVVGEEGDRRACLHLFMCLLGNYLCLSSKTSIAQQRDYRRLIRRQRHHLKGKNLACWCPPPAPGEIDLCHAQVLIEVANPEFDWPKRKPIRLTGIA